MHQGSLLSEAIMEEVIYEDLPSNLCAIRDYIEKKEAENSVHDALTQEMMTLDPISVLLVMLGMRVHQNSHPRAMMKNLLEDDRVLLGCIRILKYSKLRS